MQAVAQLSGDFASGFGGRDRAFLAGRWHDLGKYRDRFQRDIRAASGLDRETAHIESRPGRTPHSTAGALLAEQRLGLIGRVAVFDLSVRLPAADRGSQHDERVRLPFLSKPVHYIGRARRS